MSDSLELLVLDSTTRLELQDMYEVIEVFQLEINDGMNEIIISHNYPAAATEGLISSVYDFVMTCISTVAKFIENVINWFNVKIKHLLNVRLRIKKHNDDRLNKFLSMYNGLTGQQKVEANTLFKGMSIDYCPPHAQYVAMCNDFDKITNYLASEVTAYVTRDIALFGVEAEEATRPAWLTDTLLDVLMRYNIKFTDGEITYVSPFTQMSRINMGDSGYNIEQIKEINSVYVSKVFANLRILIGLKSQFEEFKNAINKKKADAKRLASTNDKNNFARATKKISQSINYSAKVVNYLTMVEEALDTRRGWIIMKGVEACTKTLKPAAAE